MMLPQYNEPNSIQKESLNTMRQPQYNEAAQNNEAASQQFCYIIIMRLAHKLDLITIGDPHNN